MILTLPPLHAVVFDLDGTLVDTLGDFHAALVATLAELGEATLADRLTPAQVEPWVGKGSEHLIRSALAQALRLRGGDRQAEVERLYPPAWAAYQAHYARINGLHARLYPGAREVLQRLGQGGRPLACLTNKPLAFARDLLERQGLLPAFAQVFGGDSFARKKPDPLPLLKTCEALGTPPARTLMVGDSVNDAQAARAAGCPVVLVSHGYNHGQPVRSVDADGHIDHLDELC